MLVRGYEEDSDELLHPVHLAAVKNFSMARRETLGRIRSPFYAGMHHSYHAIRPAVRYLYHNGTTTMDARQQEGFRVVSLPKHDDVSLKQPPRWRLAVCDSIQPIAQRDTPPQQRVTRRVLYHSASDQAMFMRWISPPAQMEFSRSPVTNILSS